MLELYGSYASTITSRFGNHAVSAQLFWSPWKKWKELLRELFWLPPQRCFFTYELPSEKNPGESKNAMGRQSKKLTQLFFPFFQEPRNSCIDTAWLPNLDDIVEA